MSLEWLFFDINADIDLYHLDLWCENESTYTQQKNPNSVLPYSHECKVSMSVMVTLVFKKPWNNLC